MPRTQTASSAPACCWCWLRRSAAVAQLLQLPLALVVGHLAMSPPALPPLPHTSHPLLPLTQVVILELLDHKPLLTGGYKAVLHIHSSELQGKGGAEGVIVGSWGQQQELGPATTCAAQQLVAVRNCSTAAAAALTCRCYPALPGCPPALQLLRSAR